MAKRLSGRTFIVGAVIAGVGLLTEGVITWIRKETPPDWAPVTTAAATVLFAGLNAVVEKGREEPSRVNQQPAYYQPAYGPGYPPGYRPAPPPPRTAPAKKGFGVATVLVVLLLVCGVGGWAASVYVPKAVMAVRDQTLAPWERGLGDSTERLAGQAVTTTHNLTITVTGVAVYQDETVVSLTVRNDNPDTAHMPVFSSAQLRVSGRSTLQPDVARTDNTWGNDVAGGGGDLTGSIAFTGALAADARAATLTFTSVLVGFDNISVNVPLTLN